MAVSVIAGMVIFSSAYYQKDLLLPMKHYFFEFIKIGFIAVLSWAIAFVVIRYAVTLPAGWNRWWGTFIKETNFLVTYGTFEYLAIKNN